MNTKTIFAEQLKKGDTIVIPASTQTNKSILLVSETPNVGELTVNGFVITRAGFKKPMQFGRKVSLDIITD